MPLKFSICSTHIIDPIFCLVYFFSVVDFSLQAHIIFILGNLTLRRRLLRIIAVDVLFTLASSVI